MSSSKQYAMYGGEFFVKILNDDSARDHNIKIIRMGLWSESKSLIEVGSPKWVHMTEIEKLDPAVVNIMVASNAI